jgi:alpha-galactosidase
MIQQSNKCWSGMRGILLFKKILLVVTAVGGLCLLASAQGFIVDTNSDLAPTPPMGWNSWNTFGGQINEKVVRGVVDKMVGLGLKDLGYKYIVIDDHWEGRRDASGHLLANPQKFPDGIKALADYIHHKGLKLGIYSCAGDTTCGGEVGSYGHEQEDAATFASWGVDYLKYDYCNAPEDLQSAIHRYTKMAEALRATGRPIVFSVCEWGVRAPWLWARQAGGQLWRISYDVGDMWDTPNDTHSCIGILTAIDASVNLAKYVGPNGWNDPDMLVVGLTNTGNIKGGGCTTDEYQTQMSMWCMLAAPLMIGCDIRSMNAETKRILMNPEVIAVDQDTLGRQASRVARTASTGIWLKPLANGDLAIALLNRGRDAVVIRVNWDDLKLNPESPLKIRDLWKHKDLGTYTADFSTTVAPHATVLLRATPVNMVGVSAKVLKSSLADPK